MNKQLIQLINYEFPKLWEDMKESALKKDKNYDMTKVELEVLKMLRKNNSDTVDLKNFKGLVDQRMKELYPDPQKKQAKHVTLEMLYDSIEGIKSMLNNKDN